MLKTLKENINIIRRENRRCRKEVNESSGNKNIIFEVRVFPLKNY